MKATAITAQFTRSGFGIGYLLLLIVRAYRALLAPVLPRVCRFEPSCSAYAEEALSRQALFPALALIVRRILRCHPFHSGGYDPVP